MLLTMVVTVLLLELALVLGAVLELIPSKVLLLSMTVDGTLVLPLMVVLHWDSYLVLELVVGSSIVPILVVPYIDLCAFLELVALVEVVSTHKDCLYMSMHTCVHLDFLLLLDMATSVVIHLGMDMVHNHEVVYILVLLCCSQGSYALMLMNNLSADYPSN